MKLKWSLAVVFAFFLGAFIAYYLTHPETSEKLSFTQSEEDEAPADADVSLEMTLKPNIEQRKATEQKGSSQKKPSKTVELKATPEKKEKKKLDLSLPKDWDQDGWQKPQQKAVGPDFFKPQDAKKFNLSTKLHWDESEEARTMSIEKTIEGAELELQFKLP